MNGEAPPLSPLISPHFSLEFFTVIHIAFLLHTRISIIFASTVSLRNVNRKERRLSVCLPSTRRRRDAPAYDTPASNGTPQIGAKVAEIITKLTLMSAGVDEEFPFTMVVDDPSGNSFVENPSAPNKDPALTVSPH